MPLLGLGLIYYTAAIDGFNPYLADGQKKVVRELFGLAFLFTFFIPALAAVIFKKMKLISSLHMENQHERNLPFVVTSASFLILNYILLKYFRGLIHPFLIYVVFGATLSVIAALINNFFWKISIHMMGIGGVCGMIFTLTVTHDLAFNHWLYILVVIAGFVGYSRLTLKAHTTPQVIGGFILGVLSESIYLVWVH